MRFPIATLLLFLLTPVIGTAQKVLVIDTLVNSTHDKWFWLENSLIQQCDIIESVISKQEYIENFELKSYYSVLVTNIKSDELCLKLDTKGSYVKLINLNSFPTDTIRLDKWEVFKNGINDTMKGIEVSWLKVNNNIVESSRRIKEVFEVVRNKGIKYIDTLTIEINGRVYNVVVAKRHYEEEITYDIYKPRNRYERQSNKKYKCYYGTVTKGINIFTATIEL